MGIDSSVDFDLYSRQSIDDVMGVLNEILSNSLTKSV